LEKTGGRLREGTTSFGTVGKERTKGRVELRVTETGLGGRRGGVTRDAGQVYFSERRSWKREQQRRR